MAKRQYKVDVKPGASMSMSSGTLHSGHYGVVLFGGVEAGRTAVYVSLGSEAKARRAAAALAARYQSYYERTGRRWEVEQAEIKAREKADRQAKRASAALICSTAVEMLEVIEDFVRDYNNGLEPDIARLADVAKKARGEA